jgi:uncharacterized damage-inducible protein DinB
MNSQIIETWQIHNRINLYLLDSIAEDNLIDIASSKGRNVGEQFAHIHNVRLMWVQSVAPEWMNDLTKIEKDKINKTLLTQSLIQSGEIIEKVIEKGLNEGKIKGFKPHPVGFLGYLISHESHHRGQITVCLKQSGHPVDKKTGFGLWEWGVR